MSFWTKPCGKAKAEAVRSEQADKGRNLGASRPAGEAVEVSRLAGGRGTVGGDQASGGAVAVGGEVGGNQACEGGQFGVIRPAGGTWRQTG